MTERKPKGVSFEQWSQHQVDVAARAGAFENLPGAGQPFRDLDKPYDPNWWVKQLVAREQINLLSPAIEIRRKLEQMRAGLAALETESEARAQIEALSREIVAVNARAADGPATQLSALDVETELARWRAARADAESRPSRGV